MNVNIYLVLHRPLFALVSVGNDDTLKDVLQKLTKAMTDKCLAVGKALKAEAELRGEND